MAVEGERGDHPHAVDLDRRAERHPGRDGRVDLLAGAARERQEQLESARSSSERPGWPRPGMAGRHHQDEVLLEQGCA